MPPGNMLSDGSNTFTWDARGQVSSVNAVSPLYDAFGRRTKNLTGTQMLFDGANSVQEIVGSTVTANRLTGGLDEFFSRADSTGSYYPLSDNLGSTVALTDSSPNVVTAYTYDPYGATSASGSNSNSYDYTGRENEGNGLYYYRARYYEPTLGRFISEDPVGFLGGIDGHAYAHENPVNLRDPSGKGVVGAIIGLGNGIAFGALGAMTGDDWSWGDVIAGAAIGGVLGGGVGLLDPTEGALTSPVAAAAGDLAGQMTHRILHGQSISEWHCYNWTEVLLSGAGGALGGALGLELDALGAAAGIEESLEGYNSLAFAENLLGNNVGVTFTAVGGVAGNAMVGHKCGCN